MITGVVKAGREALLDLPVRGPDGTERVVEAVIDAGFTGFLTLPGVLIAALRPARLGRSRVLLADGREVALDLYEIDVRWDGSWRTVRADAVDAQALVGMGLLAGYRFCLDAVADGRMTIEPIS